MPTPAFFDFASSRPAQLIAACFTSHSPPAKLRASRPTFSCSRRDDRSCAEAACIEMKSSTRNEIINQNCEEQSTFT